MAAQALHKNCRRQTGGVWSVVNHLQKYRFQFQTRSKRHQNSPVSGLISFHFNSTTKITPRMHQNAPFCPLPIPLPRWGRGHPLTTPYPPRRLRRLDPRAFGARPPQSPTEIAATATNDSTEHRVLSTNLASRRTSNFDVV